MAGVLLLGGTVLFARLFSSVMPVIERFCPGSRDPSVILCEDFENDFSLSRWDVGSNRNTWPASEFVRCSGAAIEIFPVSIPR